DQLGQGKENARNFLKDNPDLADEIEKKILEKLGIGTSAKAVVAEDPGVVRARSRPECSSPHGRQPAALPIPFG
ncbi:DNA recombination/repair protein RecA, partial [Streptomyces microflavus]